MNRKGEIAVLKIRGMHCVACARSIEKHLSKKKGVSSVNIIFAAERAFIKYTSPWHLSRR